jgi:hypothetical protein
VIRSSLLAFILLGFAANGLAQTYSFKSRDSYQRNFEILPEGDGLYCLFQVSPNKAPTTVFRKVFLDQELQPIDSVDYAIDGQASLLASGGDEQFVFHAFYTKSKSVDKIDFIVSDNLGRVVSTFSKTANDFAPLFSKPVKKVKQIRLSFLANTGSPGMMLLQPFLIKGSIPYAGKIIAVNSEDGKVLWASNAMPLSRIQVTDKLIVGLSSASAGYSYAPSYQIQFIDKATGEISKTMPVLNGPRGYRSISVFATNGQELMMAGSEYETNNSKHGKFFMTMLSLNGEKIFDKVDSAERLSSRRMHLMGNVFDQDGNLVLVAEGWKPDVTRAVAATAASVIFSAAFGTYSRVYASVDHKIDNVIFATLSPMDGKLINFKSFPVGPWLDFGRLLTEGSHAVIAVNREALSYDVNAPNTPPTLLTVIHSNENLILTSFGPIVTRWTGTRITLNRLHNR